MAQNSINGSYSLYQEVSRKDCEAALQLCKIKNQILDPEEAHQLEQEKLRQKYISLCSPSNIHRPLPPNPVCGLVGQYCSFPLEKLLTKSDLKTDQRRLLLRKSDVKQYLYPLLSTGEVKKIEQREIYVNVYDGEGCKYEMDFKLWGEKAYVLTNKNWLKFCSDHNLVEERDRITIWMFKHAYTYDQLCFAIVPNYKQRLAAEGMTMRVI